MDAQVRADLEGTFAKVQENWDGPSHCLQHCITDHLVDLYDNNPTEWRLRLSRIWEALGFKGPMAMYAWNDAPGRTKDEVLGLIKDALNNS